MRVWIDTDVGSNPDDAVALLLATRHPNVELIGVSTVSGDVAERASIARRLLGGATPIVTGGGNLVDRVDASQIDLLLAIGPLTNVANLVEAGAAPDRVVVMGGALHPVEHRGRHRRIETNVGADPGSAARVLASGVCTLVPLDVTSAMIVDDDARRRLARAHHELEAHLDRWPHPLCLHDPLALLVAVGEARATTEIRRLDVDAEGALVDGGSRCAVVTSVDVDAARGRILELLT